MSEQYGVTIDEMVSEVKREIALRERVYPKWIDGGRLKPSDAQNRIRVMRAILQELEGRKQPTLI